MKFKSKTLKNFLDAELNKPIEEKDEDSINFSQYSKEKIDMSGNNENIKTNRAKSNNLIQTDDKNLTLVTPIINNIVRNGQSHNTVLVKKVDNSKMLSSTYNPSNYLKTNSFQNFSNSLSKKKIIFSENQQNNLDEFDTSRDIPLIPNTGPDINNTETITDRLRYDISKKHISFSKRKILKKNSTIDDSIKNLTTERKNNKFITSIPEFKNKNKNYWKRMKILVLVINTVSFVRKELNNFGVTFNPDTIEKYIKNINLVNLNGNKKEKFELYNSESIIRKISTCIILPETFAYRTFQFIMIIFYLYFCPIYCFRQGFLYKTYLKSNDYMFKFDILVEFVFLIEIIVSFLTANRNLNGAIEGDFNQIFFNYFKGWMLIDIITIFPFFLFEKIIFEILGILKFLRIFKLSYLLNRNVYLNEIRNYLSFRKTQMKLLWFFLNSLAMCFTFACIWGFSARFGFFSRNWIYRYELSNASPFILFIKSLYFAYTIFITVGYGDITVFTTAEIIIVCFWICVCGLYYSFSLTSLSNIFLEGNKNNLKINNKCNIVEEIFRGSRLEHLTLKTTEYIKISQESDKEILYSLQDLRKLLEELPLNIKIEIAFTIFDGRFRQISLGNKLSQEFIGNIIPLMQSTFIEKSNYIYFIDEVPEKLYFITEGTVCFLNEDGIVWQNLSQGSYFGDIEILKKSFRDSTTKSRTNTHLLSLTKSVVWNDIQSNHKNEFKFLIHNMVKRYRFYCETQIVISKIIEEGKALFCKELAEIIKKNNGDFSYHNNSGKYFFGFGILNRLNQLKLKKDSNQKVGKPQENYNIEAIKHVLNSSIEDNKGLEGEKLSAIRRNKKILSIKSMEANVSVMKNEQRFKFLKKNTMIYLKKNLRFEGEFENTNSNEKKNSSLKKPKNKMMNNIFEKDLIKNISNSAKKEKKIKFNDELNIFNSEFEVDIEDLPKIDKNLRKNNLKRKRSHKLKKLKNKLALMKERNKILFNLLGDFYSEKNSNLSSKKSDSEGKFNFTEGNFLNELKSLNFQLIEKNK